MSAAHQPLRPPARCLRLLPLALLQVTLAVTCFAQGKIQFTGILPGSYTSPVGSYSEAGAQITGGFALVGSGLSGYPDNGTGYLQLPGGNALRFGLISGAPFNFLSLDIAESVTNLVGPVSIQFVGFISGGQGLTVTNIFTTDGINDGTGPLPDFQTFTLDSQFQNIFRLDILGGPYSLDNLTFTGIPEPSTAALLVLGTLGIFGYARRKQKSAVRPP